MGPGGPEGFLTEEFQRHDAARLLDLHRLGGILPACRPARCCTTPPPSGCCGAAGPPPIGVAPRYLPIAGKWQDHGLLQLLNEPEMR